LSKTISAAITVLDWLLKPDLISLCSSPSDTSILLVKKPGTREYRLYRTYRQK
jgi:hypothetical protein